MWFIIATPFTILALIFLVFFVSGLITSFGNQKILWCNKIQLNSILFLIFVALSIPAGIFSYLGQQDFHNSKQYEIQKEGIIFTVQKVPVDENYWRVAFQVRKDGKCNLVYEDSKLIEEILKVLPSCPSVD